MFQLRNLKHKYLGLNKLPKNVVSMERRMKYNIKFQTLDLDLVTLPQCSLKNQTARVECTPHVGNH